MTESITPDQFNPEDPEVQKDPYPYYPVLRTQRPVLKSSVGGQPCWVFSKREDITKALMDSETYSNRTTPLPNMLFVDSPEHERLRRMVSGMFTRAAVQPMAEFIDQTAERLIADILPSCRCDIIGDFAGPLTITMIGRMLGITGLHVEKLRELSSLFVEYVLALQVGRTPSEESRVATEELTRFMTGLAESRSYVDGGVIAVLAAARASGDLTDEEFVHFAILLLLAGHSTTTNLIGNAVYMLAQRPQDLERLAEDTAFVSPFMEEVLRTRPSFHREIRITARDVEVAGEFIPAGSVVRLLLASANRDPAYYEAPETFDPDLKRRMHLSFGQGIHSCLGSWLARLEGATALTVIARRLGSIALDPIEEPILFSGGTFNEFGFKRLPVILTPRVRCA